MSTVTASNAKTRFGELLDRVARGVRSAEGLFDSQGSDEVASVAGGGVAGSGPGFGVVVTVASALGKSQAPRT